jgi:hypothetical protein
VITFSGPISREHEEWVAVVAGGQGAVLAGLAAARLDGLTGFTDRKIHLLVPGSRRVVRDMPADAVVHRSGVLGPSQVHPLRLPPRTRPARSLVDAAAWMGTENGARAVLAAGVQQRLVRVEDLRQVLERRPGLRRRALIAATLRDIAGGAEALSKLDFCRLTRATGCPSRTGRPSAGTSGAIAAGWTRTGSRPG